MKEDLTRRKFLGVVGAGAAAVAAVPLLSKVLDAQSPNAKVESPVFKQIGKEYARLFADIKANGARREHAHQLAAQNRVFAAYLDGVALDNALNGRLQQLVGETSKASVIANWPQTIDHGVMEVQNVYGVDVSEAISAIPQLTLAQKQAILDDQLAGVPVLAAGMRYVATQLEAGVNRLPIANTGGAILRPVQQGDPTLNCSILYMQASAADYSALQFCGDPILAIMFPEACAALIAYSAAIWGLIIWYGC